MSAPLNNRQLVAQINSVIIQASGRRYQIALDALDQGYTETPR